MAGQRASEEDRAERLERRLAVPVIFAALVSVPAVFLTTLGGPAEQVGSVLNWASLAVLTGESAVLFVVARDRVAWLREHWAVVAITLVAIPAVVFAVGPVQLLRLLRFARFIGALRIVRVNRILKAGRILRNRADLDGFWRNAIAVAITVVAAAFVGLVLADPTSHSRRWLQDASDRFGLAPVVLAALILGVATFVVVRARTTSNEEETTGQPTDGQATDGQASDGQASEGQAADGQAGDGQASEGQAADGQAGDGQAGEGQATGGQAGGGQAGEGQAGEGR